MTSTTKQAKDYRAAITAAREDEAKRAVAASVARLRADAAAGIEYPGFPGEEDASGPEAAEPSGGKIAEFCAAPVLTSALDHMQPAAPRVDGPTEAPNPLRPGNEGDDAARPAQNTKH